MSLISNVDGVIKSTNPLDVKLTAGSLVLGQVSINQTTPGTTNGVQVVSALPAGTNDIGNVGLVVYSGTASGGSTTTIVDATKNFETNIFANKIASVVLGGIEYLRKITANNATTLTFPAIVAAVAASAAIGTGTDGVVTTTVVTAGAAGNAYDIVVVAGEGNDVTLAAALADSTITVTLGTDGAGALDNAKNTATLIAGVIDALPAFTSVASGTGATAFTAAISSTDFAGGIDAVPVVASTAYKILNI